MRVVVVGGGLAAASAVDELRSNGHEGSIEVFCAEPHLPYERPPLSKEVLLGSAEEERVFVHDKAWYDERDVTLHLDTPVTGLGLDRRQVVADGRTADFDHLLLATGASPRRLAMADDSGAEVAYLRTLEDNRRLREAFGSAGRIAIIGGGWIGLEVAAAARNAGVDVTVVEMQDLPLLGVLGPEVARVFADLHREHDVDLRLGVGVDAIEAGDGGASEVRLADGTSLPADLVVVGIGVQPEVGLAREAGLAVGDGVLVDARLRTSDPHVFAVGDIAGHDHPVLGRRIRVEHWDNAIHQARAAARVMLGGDQPYHRLPYFFTDQYDLGMEYVGSVGPDGYDEVVLRGDVSTRVFTALWLKSRRVVAAMHANDWDQIDPIRGIVGREVDRDQLADASVPLDEVS
ncbi:MAG TPA: FAD-dependent oxidoreductase [Nocardioides sp.]|nr:FAD-dependent oxidoreductase [Nocardioides sp.]